MAGGRIYPGIVLSERAKEAACYRIQPPPPLQRHTPGVCWGERFSRIAAGNGAENRGRPWTRDGRASSPHLCAPPAEVAGAAPRKVPAGCRRRCSCTRGRGGSLQRSPEKRVGEICRPSAGTALRGGWKVERGAGWSSDSRLHTKRCVLIPPPVTALGTGVGVGFDYPLPAPVHQPPGRADEGEPRQFCLCQSAAWWQMGRICRGGGGGIHIFPPPRMLHLPGQDQQPQLELDRDPSPPPQHRSGIMAGRTGGGGCWWYPILNAPEAILCCPFRPSPGESLLLFVLQYALPLVGGAFCRGEKGNAQFLAFHGQLR